ncbi:hypothetical protein EON65_21105 [archaeon]|nr:MAG: hypothetical protein EON65_21105 [archaeon]
MSLPPYIRASTAEPGNMKVAKLMHFETHLARLTSDVEKLMNISAQHGMKIKELIVAAANSVSQVEFMSAITTTRFQNLNVVKTMKSDKEEGGPHQDTSHNKISAANAVATAMQEEMKAQLIQMENEIFNQNFKSGIDMKKVENENKIRQKEIFELKSHIRSLEQKLEKFAEAVEAGGIHTNIKFAPPPADPNRRKQSIMVFSDDLEEDETRNANSASNDPSEGKEHKDKPESVSAAEAVVHAQESVAAIGNAPVPIACGSKVDYGVSHSQTNQVFSNSAAEPGVSTQTHPHHTDPSLATAFHTSIPPHPLPAITSWPATTPPTHTAERIRRMSLARQSSPHSIRLTMHSPPTAHPHTYPNSLPPMHTHAGDMYMQPPVQPYAQHFPSVSGCEVLSRRGENDSGGGGGMEVGIGGVDTVGVTGNVQQLVEQNRVPNHSSNNYMQPESQFLQMPVWNPHQQQPLRGWGVAIEAPHSGGGVGCGNGIDESDIDVEMICQFICTQMHTMKMVEQVSSQLAVDAIDCIVKKNEKLEGRNHNGKVVIERMIQTDVTCHGVGTGGVVTAVGGSPRRRSSIVKLVDSKRSSFFSSSFMSQFNSDGDSVAGGGSVGGGNVGSRDRSSVANLLLDFQNNLSGLASSAPFHLADRPASKDRRKAISRQSSIRKSILRNEGIEVVYSVDSVTAPPPVVLAPDSTRSNSVVALPIDTESKVDNSSTIQLNAGNSQASPGLSPIASPKAMEGKKGSPVSSSRKNSSTAKAAEPRKNSSTRKNSGNNRSGRKVSAPPPVARHPSFSQPSAPLDYISDHSLDLQSNQPSLVLANTSVDTPPGHPSQPVEDIGGDVAGYIRSPSVDKAAPEEERREQQAITMSLPTQPSQNVLPIVEIARGGSSRQIMNLTSQSRQASYQDHSIESEVRDDQEASQEEKITELVYIEPLTIEDIDEDDPDYNVYGELVPTDPEQALKRLINETIENKMFALCNHVNVRFQVLSDAINQHMFHHIDTLYQKVTAMQEYIYKYSYPNFKDLINQYNDLVDRVNELETWDEALLGPLQLSVEKYREEIDEIRQTVEDFIATHDQENRLGNVDPANSQIKSSLLVDMEAVDRKVKEQKDLFLSYMSSPSHPQLPDSSQVGEVSLFEMDAATKQLKHYAMLCEDIYGQHVQLSQRLNKMESRYRISQNKHYSDSNNNTNSPSRLSRGTVCHNMMEFPSPAAPPTPSTQGRGVRPSTSASTPAKSSQRIAFSDDMSAPNTPSLSRSQHFDIINIMGNEMKALKHEVETLKNALQEQVMKG